MKAVMLVQHGAADQAFELREVATPEPGPGQVRIAVEVFGLNYADVSARQGTYLDAPPIPCVIGYEVVGRVDALGDGAAGPAVGTRVTALHRFRGYGPPAVAGARRGGPNSANMGGGGPA